MCGGCPFHHDDLDYWPSSNKVCAVAPLRMMTMATANMVGNGLQSEYVLFKKKVVVCIWVGAA